VGAACHPGEKKVTYEVFLSGELKDMVVSVFGRALYEKAELMVKSLVETETQRLG
jgi:hypothetical protein